MTDAFWWLVGLLVLGAGIALIAGSIWWQFHDDAGGSWMISGLGVAGGVTLVLLVVGIAIGAIRFSGSGPLAPGCYYADVTTSTTYAMVGKVLVPIQSNGNVFYAIECPSGVGR